MKKLITAILLLSLLLTAGCSILNPAGISLGGTQESAQNDGVSGAKPAVDNETALPEPDGFVWHAAALPVYLICTNKPSWEKHAS